MIELRTLGALDLRSTDGRDLRALLKGPKRVALLAYLALAEPRGFHRRDTLLALFWPEHGERRARSSLRNTLHVLRGFLGPEVLVNRGDEEVGIAEGALWCDAVAFREACGAGELERAVELYRGDLLGGFFAPNAPAFDDWLDRRRDELRRAAYEAAWTLAEAEASAGNGTAAALRARQAAHLCPLDEEAARRLIRLLDRIGDRAGALAAFEAFAARLRAELYGDPSPETLALVEEVRGRDLPHPPGADRAPGAAAAPPPPPAPMPAPVPAGGAGSGSPAAARAAAAPPARRSRRVDAGKLLAATALVALALLALGGLWRSTGARPEALVLAVGEVRVFGGEDETGLGRVLPDMLSTSLARVEGIRVISSGRLSEVMGGLGTEGTIARAARAAGAAELLEGTLARSGSGRLRLDLRRVDLRSGEVLAVYQAEADDAFVLVDRLTAELLADFRFAPPAAGIASVSTGSLLAYRFYEEGVRAYYQGDNRTARRFLDAAIAEDSLFAMATYYRAQSRRTIDYGAFRDDLHRAARLAARASDRERLLIRSAWAQAMDEPEQLALADSLVRRFPTEPEGHLFLGKARMWGGDFLEARVPLRRAIEMDSLSLRGGSVRCLACDALNDLVTAYTMADSLAAAEREAAAWTRAQPRSARAWHALASTLEYQGRLAEAQGARARAAALRSDNPRDPLYPTVLALRAGDFARADRLLDELEAPGSPLVQQNVLWYRTLSLRYQGRLEEALAVARDYRLAVREAETAGHSTAWAAVLEALALMEAGRPREAVPLWREMAAAQYDADSPARSARHRAWTLTHAAAALAMAGDTTRLGALADSIEALGRQSAYGRDPRLHHYVRGLLLAARGDDAAAAQAYDRAMYSRTSGYGRLNLELGRALLASGQPERAAGILGAALRGPLDAANLYVSRTEVHELLAHAWEAAARPDSAAVHYGWTARAWTRADPPLAARRENVQRRLARLTLR
jgi:DNA-binding SARP family transcriptional activator